MNTSTKILIFLGSIVLIGSLIFIIVKQNEIVQRQKAIETSVVTKKQLEDDILRAQAQYATKSDIEAFAKANDIKLSVIHDDLAKMGAKVTGVNVVNIRSDGQVVTNKPSTDTTPRTEPGDTKTDVYGYLAAKQGLRLDETFGDKKVPVGQVDFSAWRKEPWDITIYPRQYRLTTVVGKDEDGREYVYNKFSIDSNGQNHDLRIDDSKFLQEYPSAKFSFWNPRLYLGVSGGASVQTYRADFVPTLGLGIMSYGQFKGQPDWVFVTLAAGYAIQNEKFMFGITPAMYNIGRHIPWTKNIYLGPTIGVDTASTVYLLGTINVGL